MSEENEMKKGLSLGVSFTSMCLFFSGCSASLDADKVYGEITQETDFLKKAGFWDFPELMYNFGISAKRWAPVIIVFSILAGCVVYQIFKKNKEVQKWAVSNLVIKIPAGIFILVYLYCFLYGVFNL